MFGVWGCQFGEKIVSHSMGEKAKVADPLNFGMKAMTKNRSI